MVSKIKSLHLINFKGVSDKEYEINGQNVEIKGQNGAGKTTIATAFYWVFADRDYDLHSNPSIRKIGEEESDPRVEIILDIDGKEISVAKIQKRTVRKSRTGGSDSVSLKNIYEVNSVEYGERDFKVKLMEYGFDIDLFLPLSHPEVFTSKKADEMRKVLFSMAGNYSDLEIANMTKGCDLVSEMLKTYSMEEIKAMQNSIIKKIREVYGKSGELLVAKIQGLESAKVDIDVAELELAKKAVMAELNINLDKQTDMSKQLSGFQELSDGILELKFAQGDLKTKAHELTMEMSKQFEAKVSQARAKCNDIVDKIMETDLMIKRTEKNLVNAKDDIEICRMDWKRVHETKFDESTLICPTCGQDLPEDKKVALVSEFSEKKQKQLDNITIKGNSLKRSIERMERELSTLTEMKDSLKQDKFEAEKELAEIKAAYVDSLRTKDVSESDEWKDLQKQIDEKEKVLKDFSSIQDIQVNLKHEESELRLKLNEIMAEIAKAQNNVHIDERILKLRADQIKYEQDIADAENILDQLNLLGKKKNEILSDEINKNFKLVKFKLFDYQKNGEYKEVCVPTFKGKDMNVSTNTGLEIMMKLDIINGLQNFYGMRFPVFIDGAECLDSESKKKIDMDCQLVYLTVSDCKLSMEV